MMRGVARQLSPKGTRSNPTGHAERDCSTCLRARSGLMDDVIENFKTGGLSARLPKLARSASKPCCPVAYAVALTHSAARPKKQPQTLGQIAGTITGVQGRTAFAGNFSQLPCSRLLTVRRNKTFCACEKFREYFQSGGYDPSLMAEAIPGVTSEDFDLALSTGGDIKIPTASLASNIFTYGGDHSQFFIENSVSIRTA